jgi:hypothetical protein
VIHAGFVAGYAESIQTVFLIAVPIAVLAFLASWLIPQVELKQWPEEENAGPTAPKAESDGPATGQQPGRLPTVGPSGPART